MVRHHSYLFRCTHYVIAKLSQLEVYTPRNMMRKITRDTKGSFTKPMCSTVTTILELIDRLNGKQYSIQFGKVFIRKELCPAITRLMTKNTSACIMVIVCYLETPSPFRNIPILKWISLFCSVISSNNERRHHGDGLKSFRINWANSFRVILLA